MTSAVLSPHLDDAVLSCWNLLEAAGDLVVVDVCTASPAPGSPLPAWDRLTGAQDPVTRMRERRAEERRALGLVGRDAIALGLLDAQYGGSGCTAAWLAARVAAALEPGTVLHAPADLGGHPDHALVRDAALELARDGWPVRLYADIPHCIRHGWPAWVTGSPEVQGSDIGAAWSATLAASGLATERLRARVRPLDGPARDRKLRALAEYRTQRAALDDLAFAPLDDPGALAFEVSWEVPSSALRGRDERGGERLVAKAGGKPVHERC